MAQPQSPALPAPLSGMALLLGGLLLAGANFLVVLDMTIANVAVPHIAGGLAVSPAQGTWVITSYAVAEAISVPLTGWLAGRFGMVKTFVWGMAGFGVCSLLCSLAPTLGFLIAARILQGLCGGPLMPLSQTLLLRIFPKEKQPQAISLWSMTTLVAPILGPILGGALCDTVGWPSIFYINVPIAAVCAWFGWRVLKSQETPTARPRFDIVGLLIMLVWVGALQIMLDEGKNHDWFASPLIVGLAVVAAVGFVAFLIWELTEEHPIVPLKVFRYRGYTAGVITLCVAFGGFFAGSVMTPLWLQGIMGYTATWSGYATAMSGILAVIVSPIAAQLSARVDPRKLVFFGVCWLGMIAVLRGTVNTDVTFWQVALPLLAMGIGMPFFFVPLTGMTLASVKPHETAGAAGLMNFARTLTGAFAVSLMTTAWENGATHNRAELSGLVNPSAVPQGVEVGVIDRLVEQQAVMISTNTIFLVGAVLFAASALVVWLIPRPRRAAPAGAAH